MHSIKPRVRLAPAANGNAIDFDHSDDAQPALGFDVGSDSDDSGWLIDESRITFTEAGYALYSNGFDDVLDEDDDGVGV